MAGAASVPTDATPPAPSAAVRKNLRRCMVFLPGTFLVFAKRLFHRAESACQYCRAWANKKPRRSGACVGPIATGSEFIGCRLAGHEVVEGVLDHPEPQHLLV